MISKPSVITTNVLGNPGSGKSCLLNCFCGRVLFRSGISLGKGLTQICQCEVCPDGNKYVDTPGLDDIKLRKAAAKEIKKSFSEGGGFKTIFVITTDEGRIRPNDKTTMKLILDAVPQLNANQYSVIINKLSSSVFEALSDPSEFSKFLVLLFEDLPPTSFVYLNKFDEKLQGATNALVELEPELRRFIEDAPVVSVVPEEVLDIKESVFESTQKLLEEKIAKLEGNKAEMEKKQIEITEKLEAVNKTNAGINLIGGITSKVMELLLLKRLLG